MSVALRSRGDHSGKYLLRYECMGRGGRVLNSIEGWDDQSTSATYALSIIASSALGACANE